MFWNNKQTVAQIARVANSDSWLDRKYGAADSSIVVSSDSWPVVK